MPPRKQLNILYLILLLTACATDKSTTGQLESEIIALAKRRSAAVVSGDTITMSSILASDFRYINIFGEVLSRKEYLKNNSSLQGDSSHWVSQDIDSIQVNLLEKSAVITFRVLDKFVYEGSYHENYCRSTFVYENQNGEWKCVVGHTTKIE